MTTPQHAKTIIFLFILLFNHSFRITAETDGKKTLQQAEASFSIICDTLSKTLFQNFADRIGTELKVKVEKAKLVDAQKKLGKYLISLFGIPFKLSAKAHNSNLIAELEEVSLKTDISYAYVEDLEKNAVFVKIKDFPEHFATWNDFLARKSGKYELRKKSKGESGVISAIEIVSESPSATVEKLPLLFGPETTSSSSGLFLDGVDITGSDAAISSTKESASTNRGFLKGVKDFLENRGNKPPAPGGLQPGSGPVVSIGAGKGTERIFSAKMNLSFLAGTYPRAHIEASFKFRFKGGNSEKELVKENLRDLEELAEMFFKLARKACHDCGIVKLKETFAEETMNISKNDGQKFPEKIEPPLDNDESGQPEKDSLSENAIRIKELQKKLEKLVPGYIPDYPDVADKNLFENLLMTENHKTESEIAAERLENETATLTSADGSALGIIGIIGPADESIGPGENFSLKINVLNNSKSTNQANYKITVFDPWTGKIFAEKIDGSGPGKKWCELTLKAPAPEHATRVLDLEIMLEPFIGTGSVNKNHKLTLRGNLSDGDILNQVRISINASLAKLQLEGLQLTESDQNTIFNRWCDLHWKNTSERGNFVTHFKRNPAEARTAIGNFSTPHGVKLLEQKLLEQNERAEKENAEHLQLQQLIKYYSLETAAYKRNAVIDYRMDPGYSLIDVLEDHVHYDPQTGLVTGDLDAARAAIVEEHWQLMKKTMSAADRYAIEAGDDGLPTIDRENQQQIIGKTEAIKNFSEKVHKALELVTHYHKLSAKGVLSLETSEKIAQLLKDTGKAVKTTGEIVGATAKPLADALAQYEGFFRNAARLNRKLSKDLNLIDLPGNLGEMAGKLAGFGEKINDSFVAFEKAVNGLGETGKTAELIRQFKKATTGLKNLVAKSLDISADIARTTVRFTDTLLEMAAKKTGKALSSSLNFSKDTGDWLNQKAASAAEATLDLGKSGVVAEESSSFLKRSFKKLGSAIENHPKAMKGIGVGIDIAGVALDYGTYRAAGQSEPESLARAIISGGIEKIAGDAYSPLGLINFGMAKTGEWLSDIEGVDELLQQKLNLKAKQVNFSTPVKIVANQGVNFIMDFYNSSVAPGERIKNARLNEDKISSLIILAENCLKMAQNSKDPEVKKAFMAKRKEYRDEIRALGGRTN